MYAALAEVVADPERRLWHRAMAAVGCDEEIAAALDAHAAVARSRGAVAVAATALERAAALSPDPVRKGERLVRAAELAYELGLVETARGLLAQVEPVEVGSLELARSAWLRHMIDGDVWVAARRGQDVRRDLEADARRRRRGHGAAVAGADRAPMLVDARRVRGHGNMWSTPPRAAAYPRTTRACSR